MKFFFIAFFLVCTALFNEKQTNDKKIIMAIFAHPDDEAVTNVSSLLARYAREGNKVYLVIATKGELGANKHAGVPAGDSLAKVRAGEALCASKALGIEPAILLGLGDGGLAKHFTGEPLHKKLDSVLPLYVPDIIITWGPDGGYGHMDHRMVHNVTTELYQTGKMKNTARLYYAGMPVDVCQQWTEQKKGKIWMYDNWNPVAKQYLTTRIKCTKDDLQKAITALYCHWSQFTKEELEETSRWMSVTNDTVYLRPFMPASTINYDLIY